MPDQPVLLADVRLGEGSLVLHAADQVGLAVCFPSVEEVVELGHSGDVLHLLVLLRA